MFKVLNIEPHSEGKYNLIFSDSSKGSKTYQVTMKEELIKDCKVGDYIRITPEIVPPKNRTSLSSTHSKFKLVADSLEIVKKSDFKPELNKFTIKGKVKDIYGKERRCLNLVQPNSNHIISVEEKNVKTPLDFLLESTVVLQVTIKYNDERLVLQKVSEFKR